MSEGSLLKAYQVLKNLGNQLIFVKKKYHVKSRNNSAFNNY